MIQRGAITIGEGRLTRDPDVKMVGTSLDKKLVKFGIAVSEKDEPGDFINAVCWNTKADYAEGLKKGDAVFFAGIDKTRKWEKDGEQKTATETEIRFIMKQPAQVEIMPF
jgi:single-stranded DNA-binding protein